jgi:hypothetical protein
MSFRMDVKVDDLDGIRRRFGSASKTLDSELRPAVREGAVLIRDEARRLAPGKKLPNSIQFKVEQGGLRSTIGSVAKTALSIHQGRRAGERVNFGLILGWVRRSGLAGAVSIKTRRPVRLRQGSSGDRALRVAAAQVVAQIRARGTKPLPIILPAVAPTQSRVQRLFGTAVNRAMRRVVR